jgi:hypothetical protein
MVECPDAIIIAPGELWTCTEDAALVVVASTSVTYVAPVDVTNWTSYAAPVSQG